MSAVRSVKQPGEGVGVVGGNHSRRVGTESDFSTRSSFFPGNSIQSKLLTHALRVTVKPALGVWAHIPSARWTARVVDQAARVLPALDGVGHRRVRLTDCDADWIQAHNADLHSVVLYLHGGGFLTGGLNTHRRLASRISQSADASVLSVNYRLMPTHAIGDAVATGSPAIAGCWHEDSPRPRSSSPAIPPADISRSWWHWHSPTWICRDRPVWSHCHRSPTWTRPSSCSIPRLHDVRSFPVLRWWR